MDDSCAVCAETLEWVAYAACGHKEVCSTCVARLRNICHDRRCCICKTESDAVFVTKAMGDYTKNIDFSSLPVGVKEGPVGPYWHHEATQAFFDDKDHYKMIKAMCTFSCAVCDKPEGQQQSDSASRRKSGFRNLHQLKGHLFHQHKLFMCKLCLEGRKVFVCEQKLYTKTQLNRHINTGDSEVDGDESERAGFMGHPMCEFCRTPFYGDNELYMHMSTEHFTCHLCQRRNPQQFEYFRNYDDLEIHFRQDHLLCEHEECLAKKFIVFISEEELKRHNALEHGGRMSRSQRNAALQIPVRFRYRRNNEERYQRGRGGRTFQRESPPDDQLRVAIQASLETASLDDGFPVPSAVSSSGAQLPSDSVDASSIDPTVPLFETITTSNNEPTPTRYLYALSQNSRFAPVGETSFPPLSSVPRDGQQMIQQDAEGSSQNSLAARLRQKNKVTVANVAQARPVAGRGPALTSGNALKVWPTLNSISGSSLSGPSQNSLPTASGSASSYVNSLSSRSATNHKLDQVGSSLRSRNQTGSSSDGRMKQSASGLEERSGSFDHLSDFPPVSGSQSRKSSEDIQTANKSLVEKIHAGLHHDPDKYAAFKEISQEYRQNTIDTWSYLHYVEQFGLSHLVPELARLCPDAQKQMELLQAFDDSLQNNELRETVWGCGNLCVKEAKSNAKAAKGKKPLDSEQCSTKKAVADNFMDTVRRLQSGHGSKSSEGETEVLEKDGYRATSGKSKTVVKESQVGLGNESHGNLVKGNGGHSGDDGSSSNKVASSGDVAGGGSKKGKKTSKFHRIRLGDGSAAAFLDLQNSANDESKDLLNEPSNGQNSSSGLPARGAWSRGGSQKLFVTSKK